MKDFILCVLLVTCLIVWVGLPVGMIAVKLTGFESIVTENIETVRIVCVAWFVSFFVLAAADSE